MSQIIEAKVPDIGDYHDVPVIDVCVQAGDTVRIDDALITLESDKATMDVPSSVAGVVKEVKVKLGDKLSEGAVVALIESGGTAATAPPVAAAAGAPPASAAPTPQAAAPITGSADLECEMLVLGAGPGGYSAAFRGADIGMQTVLVERYPTLGGVCLNVGCIPSKALLHIAGVMEEAQHMGDCGVSFAAPSIDLDKLRAHKDTVVGKLTGGLAGMAKGRKVEVVQGVGQFVDAHHLEVALAVGGSKADPLPESDHSCRLATHSRCPSCPTTRASSTRPAPSNCGRSRERMLVDRRRHHRPRNGQRLLGARLAHHGRRTRGSADARALTAISSRSGKSTTPTASIASCSTPASSPRRRSA
jgi:hypothetical protein